MPARRKNTRKPKPPAPAAKRKQEPSAPRAKAMPPPPGPLVPGMIIVDKSQRPPARFLVADVGQGWDGDSWDAEGTELIPLGEGDLERLATVRRRLLRARGWIA